MRRRRVARHSTRLMKGKRAIGKALDRHDKHVARDVQLANESSQVRRVICTHAPGGNRVLERFAHGDQSVVSAVDQECRRPHVGAFRFR
jgi:hypothetical protein